MGKQAGKALVLLSGGIDSSVCLFLAVRERGAGRVTAVTFDWGQLAWPEERAAGRALARAARIDAPRLVRVMFPYGGALTGRETEDQGEVPDPAARFFFPGRNLVMLAHAFGMASVEGADSVWFGPGAADRPYPDCRPGFVRAMEEACNLALGDESGISLHAPLIDLTKSEIVELGARLGVPLEETFSCYTPSAGAHCGKCEACRLRHEAGV